MENYRKRKAVIDGVRESGRLNTGLLDHIAGIIKEGMTTLEIDEIIYKETIKLGGVPATLNYDGYPRSLCTSINNQVCHGIPSKDIQLKDGDIINIDVSTCYRGYYSDSARVFKIGRVSPEKKILVDVSKACLEAGLSAVKPWVSLNEIGIKTAKLARKNKMTIARGIGGHGIGHKFHESPYVSYDGLGMDLKMVPGMIFTIEPAVNFGRQEVYEDASNGWTIYTVDGKPSAQWEVTVLVTETGYEVLAY